jgi:predicted ABC-type ATPase
MPVLHMIAGPNGAGKSTLYEFLVAPRYPDLPLARSEPERERLLAARASFICESAFSRPAELAFLTRAKTEGFQLVLYVVCLDDPLKLLQRVRGGEQEGADDMLGRKILERYPRTLHHLQLGVRVADLSLLIDSADPHDGGPDLVATVTAGQMNLRTATRPAWADKVLGFSES